MLAKLAKIQTLGHLAQNTELSSFQTTVVLTAYTPQIQMCKDPSRPRACVEKPGKHTLSNGKSSMEKKKWNFDTLKWKI